MDDTNSLRRFHQVILSVGITTLAVYGLAVGIALSLFREEVRSQILQRDGTLLTSVAQHFYDRLESPDDSIDLLEVALESSDLGGVIGVRIYSPTGILLGKVPASLYEIGLPASDLARLVNGTPIMRHFSAMSLETLFSDQMDLEGEEAPALTEILSPIRDPAGTPVAVIQYWLDGAEVSSELAQVDKSLVALGLAFILAGGLIFLLVFLYARHRLLKMGRLLAQRNRALEQLNQELALAARTSAIGSVTGHLFHGLKNPLAGLKSYLRLIVRDEEAVALADHMQSLIDETLSVLREEESHQKITLTFNEFVDMARTRFDGKANSKIIVTGAGHGNIPAHKAQLSMLVLRNLVDNALEATPAGEQVFIRTKMDEQILSVSVEDHGPGLPEIVRKHLFEPVTSNKVNGTGIGLAISAVIARHIPARLELNKSSPQGTTFTLEVPQ